MIYISLVRHGEPRWNTDGRCIEHPELTEVGVAQARSLGKRLACEPIGTIYCSPMRRAVQTARAIAHRCGREPTILPWLSELGHPDFDDRPTEEVDEYFRRVTARKLEDWWQGPPGGESFRDFDERVRLGLEQLLITNHSLEYRMDGGNRIWDCPKADYHLVIVSHAGTIGVMISYLLDIESVPWMYDRFRLNVGRLCRMEATPIADGAIWSIREFGASIG